MNYITEQSYSWQQWKLCVVGRHRKLFGGMFARNFISGIPRCQSRPA